jgi:hypothetical protein
MRPCRTEERGRQRDRADAKAERAAADGAHIKTLHRRAEDGEDLTVDEWRRIVADDPDNEWDFGDDIGLSIDVGAIRVTDHQLAQADALFATGAAGGILERAGVTITEFTRITGANSRRAVYNWLGGQTPKSAKARPAVAWYLLMLNQDNRESDAILTAHDLPTTHAAQVDFETTHKPLALDDPASRCAGCARARRNVRALRAA